MATRTGSAAEFILTLLEQQPDRAWRISELHAQCDGRWNVDNFHETLKRLLAAGRVKKTLGEGRSTWWSARSGMAPAPAPAASHVPPALAPHAPNGTASQFVLDLLGKQPDLEWRIREILDASGNKWREANVYNALTRLLSAGRVRKTLTERQAWWSIAGGAGTAHPAQVATPAPVAAAAPAPELPPVPKPVSPPASGVLELERPVGTATQFVVELLTSKPDLEWRIAEIVQVGGQKWTEPNVYKSLDRLFKAGKVKKTVNGGVWWSAATAASTTLAPAKTASSAAAAKSATPSASAPQEPVTAAEQSTGSAAQFILDLLTRHPDYEMQVNDIYEEAERKWAAQTISNTVEKLVKQGSVARVKDGRRVWYSIAG